MKTLAELEGKFNEYDLGNLFGYLKNFAKNAIKIEINEAKDSEIEIGKSKIGGLPDLPKNVEWFENEATKKPMSFIAQINFAEVKAFDVDNKLPENGILYLFFDVEEEPWGYDPKDIAGKKVFYFDGELTDLERKTAPKDLDEGYVFSPTSLQFASEINVPDLESNLVDFELADDENDNYWELKDEFAEYQNKILGHSDNIQGGMELECELVTNCLYCGDSSGYENPKRKELEKNISRWNLLLQIDSNDENGMMWGDSGRIYLWITDEDLKNKNFENSWLVLQCS